MAQGKEKQISSYQELKCIWVNSELFEYKLCDLNFDCENCAFDKVMRNMNHAVAPTQEEKYSDPLNILEEKIDLICAEKFEQKIIYLKNQLILKHLFANTYYIGINPFLTKLLDEITEIKEGINTTFLSKNQKIIELKGNWGGVSVCSPINFLILERIPNSPEDIKSRRWLALVGISPQELDTARLNYNDWQREQERVVSLLNEYKINQPEVGATMPDGGKLISFLSQFLGSKEYRKLLGKIVGK